MTIFAFVKRLAAILMCLGLLLAVSCQKEEELFGPVNNQRIPPTRDNAGGRSYSNVMIFALLGYNNLCDDISVNIKELCGADIPGEWEDKAVVVFSHLPSNVSKPSYSDNVSPVIFRVFAKDGAVVRDTLVAYPEGTKSADAATLSNALTFIKHNFDAAHYGLVFSSHSSGWMPANYKGESFEWLAPGLSGQAPARKERWQPIPTKSLGVQSITGNEAGYQIDLADFASAIPMHLDYIIFDCCLTGGIEVAYELREKCDLIAASPTETLTYGHVYPTLPRNMLYGSSAEEGLLTSCKEYFARYNALSGWEKSATIAIYRCSKLGGIADAMKPIIESHRDSLATVKRSSVQNYNYNYDEFYDLRDIALNIGASESELSALDAALSEAVVYKAATEYFIYSSYPIRADHYSGMSMYLPYSNRTTLGEFYKTLSWNKAVSLIQ